MDDIALKICGLTKRSPIRNIVAFPEISYIGCIHDEKSPRHESLNDIREIFDEAKIQNAKIKTVLVLFNPRMSAALDALKYTKADILQLAGDEKEIFLEQIKRHSPVILWKTIYIRDFTDLEQINILKSADYFLLDSRDKDIYENTEPSFNFGIFNHAKTYTDKLIFGGGITIKNAPNVIRICQPKIINISSGVESEVGVKDLTMISRLIFSIKS